MTQLFGQMQSRPLQISGLLRHAARHHGRQQIVSRLADGLTHRYTYADCEQRARKLARVLGSLGVQPGDRVGTLAWNDYRHLELYYAIPGSGAVSHTINPRLFVEQIVYIVNHAADTCIFFDITLTSLVETIAAQCPTVRHWICLCDALRVPASRLDLLSYEALLDEADGDYEWPELDENTASSLCYTSGTTGNPKGVLYSHRSTVLHAYGTCLPDSLALDAATVALPIVPMFHANAWAFAYAAPLVGSRLVLPGPRLDCASVYDLLESERVTLAGCVPSIWVALIDYLDAGARRLTYLKRAAIGGSAVPLSMIQALARHGVETRHAWGMTETSPVVTVNAPLAKHVGLSTDAMQHLQAKQGRTVFGADIMICDDAGVEQPWDGEAMGQIMVRGPWIARGYFGLGDSTRDGWLPTGDIASVDADGYVEIKDRSKDLIKSGGEWISSLELEGIGMSHPAVQQVACIAVPHPKWAERPVLVAILRAGHRLTREEFLTLYVGKVVKWQLPNDVVFVESLPMTATGKINKLKLRQDMAGHLWQT